LSGWPPSWARMTELAVLDQSGRVVLSRRGAELCHLALEAAFRSAGRNGLSRPPELVALARVLAEGAEAAEPRSGPVSETETRQELARRAHSGSARAAGHRPGPWLAPAEAAAQLSMSADGVRKACRRGQLPARRTERGWLVSSQAIEHYRRRQRDRAA
jgi:hypothetical protein